MKNPERVAFSPGEFAAMFGKSQTWGYRQIYLGRVNAITEHGRILIPASEIDRILATAERYEGLKPKPSLTKAERKDLAPDLPSAWQSFIQARRGTLTASAGSDASGEPAQELEVRRQALARLTRRKGKDA